MDFFKSVFSDESSDTENPQTEDPISEDPNLEPSSNPNPNPNPNPNATSAWSFGGLIKTLASKSESAIQNYRHDLEEFSSGLRKETAMIREAASRAITDLPASLEIGACVAQESLETVGAAIDDIGATVWNSTAEIISQGKGAILDLDSDSSDYGSSNSNRRLSADSSLGVSLKKYSRFDAQLNAIRCDIGTYCDEPEEKEEYEKWKLGFVLEEKREEIEKLIGENEVVGEMYRKVVPDRVDHESFWCRYFYRVNKLQEAEDARARLVKRAISGEEEEDLSWDFDDEDDEGNDVSGSKVGNEESRGEKSDEIEKVKVVNEEGPGIKLCDAPESSRNGVGGKVEETASLEGKTDNNSESGKDSDVSVVSTQPSMPEAEDLGWDEIEDVISNDETKGDATSGASRIDLRKQLNVADDDEDLSWEIEEDDEPSKS